MLTYRQVDANSKMFQISFRDSSFYHAKILKNQFGAFQIMLDGKLSKFKRISILIIFKHTQAAFEQSVVNK